MKKILKVFLSLFLLCCMFTLSACGFSDMEFGGGGAIGGGEGTQRPNVFADIGGYKVCYRPSLYPFKDYYQNISNILLDKLYSTYGMAGKSLKDDEIDQKLIEKIDEAFKSKYNINGNIDKTEARYIKFKNECLAYYSDDVRYSIFVLKNTDGDYVNANGEVLQDNDEHYFFANKGDDNKWLWNSPSSTSGVNFALSKACFEGLYSSTPIVAKKVLEYVSENGEIKNATKEYYNEIVKEFSPALQTAILQIVLGITPQSFTLEDVTSGRVNQILGTSQMQNGEVVATGLKLKFQQEATYVGLTENDREKIENYILDNVIGLDKIINGSFTREDYLQTIREVWQEQVFVVDEVENSSETYGNLFEPYPATMIKDYNENTFFISSKKGEAFKDIPQMQYQSIVIMPEKEIYLWELWLVFAGNSNLNINTYFRYYNKSNNTMTIGKPKKATTILESEFDAFKSPYYSFSINDSNGKESLFYLDEFNNNIGGGILNTNGESISMNGDISNYYDLIDSANGFSTITVLNADRFNTQDGCSYLEIVFDVERQLDQIKDYSFKVAISGTWLGTSDMIEDYKIKNN